MATSNNKTTIVGSIAGAIVAFGSPIINVLSGMPAGFKLRDFLLAISLAVLGKFAADAQPKKEE